MYLLYTLHDCTFKKYMFFLSILILQVKQRIFYNKFTVNHN